MDAEFYDNEELDRSPLAETYYAEVQRREQAHMMEMTMALGMESENLVDEVDPLVRMEEELRRQAGGMIVEDDGD